MINQTIPLPADPFDNEGGPLGNALVIYYWEQARYPGGIKEIY